jgi:two-component system response regulator ResD
LAKILVVDDRKIVRDTLKQVLEKSGHTVQLASNGQEALDEYAKDESDLVVLDMFMPILNGFDALVEFRQRHGDVKVLAMSGGGEFVLEDALDEARNLGAQRVLAKPFQMTELLEAVDELLVER